MSERHAFASVHPVIPELNDPEKLFDVVRLCRVTGQLALDGVCKIHDSDACLSLFVRYNFIMDLVDKEINHAKLRVRRNVS